jgi:hypothetical protein
LEGADGDGGDGDAAERVGRKRGRERNRPGEERESEIDRDGENSIKTGNWILLSFSSLWFVFFFWVLVCLKEYRS